MRKLGEEVKEAKGGRPQKEKFQKRIYRCESQMISFAKSADGTQRSSLLNRPYYLGEPIRHVLAQHSTIAPGSSGEVYAYVPSNASVHPALLQHPLSPHPPGSDRRLSVPDQQAPERPLALVPGEPLR